MTVPGKNIPPAVTLKVDLNPPVKAYLSYAHILSMVLAEKDSQDWYYASFIQLYSWKDTDSSWLSLQFVPDTHGLLHDQYLYKIFSLNSEIYDLNEESVIPSLKRWISQGYYIVYSLDEYYLPGTCYYEKEHIPHAQFLYGYDEEGFHLLNYDEEHNYVSVHVKNEDIIKAMLTNEMVEQWGWEDLRCHNPKLLKRSEKINREFELDIIKDQLTEYKESKGSPWLHMHNSHIHSCPDVAWGLDIYESLMTYMEKAGAKTEYMPFHLLWEHKVIMGERLNYLESRYGVSISQEVKDLWMQVEETANSLRFMALSLEYDPSEETLKEMAPLLTEMKQSEESALNALLLLL